MFVIKKTSGVGGYVFAPGRINVLPVYCDDIEEAYEFRTRRLAEESCTARNQEVVTR